VVIRQRFREKERIDKMATKYRTTFGWVAALLLVTLTAVAQMPSAADGFMRAMSASMKRMDRDMAAAPMNGNVDHDFATMMLPHHQGAIDMAKAELSYGKDPVMRRLAEEIIVDQQSEIDAMQLWLNKHAASTTKGK
jgi:uncharacterized protein (DUF305 family)